MSWAEWAAAAMTVVPAFLGVGASLMPPNNRFRPFLMWGCFGAAGLAGAAFVGLLVLASIRSDDKPNIRPSVGSESTIVGPMPPNGVGDRSTIVGATDAHGNTILNKGGTQIGYCSHADSTSVAIGAYAGGGKDCPPPK